MSAGTIRVISSIPSTGMRSSTPWIFPCSARGSSSGINPYVGMPIDRKKRESVKPVDMYGMTTASGCTRRTAASTAP